jgi:hypothetical protein
VKGGKPGAAVRPQGVPGPGPGPHPQGQPVK